MSDSIYALSGSTLKSMRRTRCKLSEEGIPHPDKKSKIIKDKLKKFRKLQKKQGVR